jgi:thymidylate kinase
MRPGKNPKSVLACFVGIDGAGKSTLAKALTANMLEEQSINCKYIWGGFNSSFVVFRPFVAVMKRLVFRGNEYMHESSTKGRALKSQVLSAWYQYLALVDYVLQALVKIRLPLALGTSVVCDRYVHDLVISIGVLLDYDRDRTMALLDRCLRVLPEPDLVFLIDLPEALAFERKGDIVSLEFLSVRRSAYLQMAEHYEMMILDGSSDPRELSRVAAGKVLRHMRGEC